MVSTPWTRPVYRSGPRKCVRGAKAGLGRAVLSLGNQATNLPELRTTGDSLDREGVSYYVERGSVCPTCGSTLHLGSPHKNSGLVRCSTRQPTVYSYTTSHRSPCIRVDSPTQFYLHLP